MSSSKDWSGTCSTGLNNKIAGNSKSDAHKNNRYYVIHSKEHNTNYNPMISETIQAITV